MDFKIEILCEKCKCSCELRPEAFKERTSMECPNCGQIVPAEVYSHLKTGMIELGKVPQYVLEDAECPFSENLFMVRVRSFDKSETL